MVIFTTATDKAQVLAKMFENKTVSYPYAFLTVQSMGSNPESRSTNMMARQGVVALVDDGSAERVRLMPCNFEIEVEFITNKFQGIEQGAVLSYIRRWLFARRAGYLKFNISYGRLALGIGVTLNDTPAIPLRDNVVETESIYKVVSTLTVHGYISEPITGTVGVIQDLQINGQSLNLDGSVPGAQFFAFN